MLNFISGRASCNHNKEQYLQQYTCYSIGLTLQSETTFHDLHSLRCNSKRCVFGDFSVTMTVQAILCGVVLSTLSQNMCKIALDGEPIPI